MSETRVKEVVFERSGSSMLYSTMPKPMSEKSSRNNSRSAKEVSKTRSMCWILSTANDFG